MSINTPPGGRRIKTTINLLFSLMDLIISIQTAFKVYAT